MVVMSSRGLNRTLLRRQFLLERTATAPLDVIERLVALQAQEPNWPYVGLWTRVAGFKHDQLSDLFQDRLVVRGSLLRTTQHVLSARDYLWMRPAVQPSFDRTMRAAYFAKPTRGLDVRMVAEAGRAMLGKQSLIRRDLGKRLGEQFPGVSGSVLAGLVQLQLALIHPPPNGLWGAWGNRRDTPVTLAEAFLDAPVATRADAARLIERYLAAFGPASVMDMQQWSGLTGLREVVAGMGLRTMRDAGSVELYDLPDGELAPDGGDEPAPVRFLPSYDNIIVGYADRSRLMDKAHSGRVTPGRALVVPTFLVDGFIGGSWAVQERRLEISPFAPLSKKDTRSVMTEAEALARFVFDGRADVEISIAPLD